MPKIVKNQAKCLKCNTTIESRSVHDFRSCKCGNIFVDGGKEYLRHGFSDPSLYENCSIFHDTPSKELNDVVNKTSELPRGTDDL